MLNLNQMIILMQPFPITYILRHRKENLKKCSLRGLESRPDFRFFTYPNTQLPDLSGSVMLAIDGEPLSLEDSHRGLFLLDATWRYAERMREFVDKQMVIETRSIPSGYRTAYPRYQNDCPNPEEGLASIEALYIAYTVLGLDVTGLLDNYYWKEEFLMKNGLKLI